MVSGQILDRIVDFYFKPRRLEMKVYETVNLKKVYSLVGNICKKDKTPHSIEDLMKYGKRTRTNEMSTLFTMGCCSVIGLCAYYSPSAMAVMFAYTSLHIPLMLQRRYNRGRLEKLIERKKSSNVDKLDLKVQSFIC